MLQSIQGTYKNGKVELNEVPQNIYQSRVIVTFLEPEPASAIMQMQFGMFSGSTQSTESDFNIAEFQGDCDDGLNW
jgi:hypothetical protein